jgi:hypothetical protein
LRLICLKVAGREKKEIENWNLKFDVKWMDVGVQGFSNCGMETVENVVISKVDWRIGGILKVIESHWRSRLL